MASVPGAVYRLFRPVFFFLILFWGEVGSLGEQLWKLLFYWDTLKLFISDSDFLMYSQFSTCSHWFPIGFIACGNECRAMAEVI